MQRLLAIALLIGAAAATGVQESARAWLSAHRKPSNDQLAELRSVNPEAYGIVKALLVKNSLGLLNLKHPQMSTWQQPPAQQQADVGSVGAAAYPQVAPIYAQAPTGGRQDFFNWKPSHREEDDDAMVKQVLGAVADLKGKKLPAMSLSSKKKATKDDSSMEDPFARDEAFFGKVDQAAQAPQQAAQPAPQPAQLALATNDYSEVTVSRHKKQKSNALESNSYLKGLDLVTEDQEEAEKPVKSMRKVPKVTTPSPEDEQVAAEISAAEGAAFAKPNTAFASADVSPLSTFAFDEDAAPPKPKPKPALAVRHTQKQEQPMNPLEKFLGLKSAASMIQEPQAPAQPADPINSYLSDLA
eukprot:gnl/TRDRNA2_/TRDRNA2_57713_c0_seq1.p1 gnl/TRDRNA2_/TRDRNA2_57713_c0~~gnl/TRDRNA2_/TRDRNA2_57713_c0_seq1.p1  ORF type:complete len:356 (-),score=102.97 gnl/TRDRNA2_/TRDRNA2_57713_c0_seq1:68-1135(-)